MNQRASSFTLKRDNRHHIILSLCFISFGAVIALLTSLVSYRLEYTNIDQEMHQRFEQAKLNKSALLTQEIATLEQVVGALSSNKLLLDFIDTPNQTSQQRVQSLFLAMMKSHTSFMQLRFLDARGHESIRIDRSRDGSRILSIADESLQDKSQRYYFQALQQIPAHQYWHSNLDLNRERGKIEMPPRPTLRVATPIYRNNLFAGSVIVNIEATRILEQMAAVTDFDVLIIDGDGEILLHTDRSLSWSRFFEQRKDFATLYPEPAKQIVSRSSGRYQDFEFFSIAPLFNNQQKLKMVMRHRQESIDNLKLSNMAATGLIALLVIGISLPLSWLAAFFPAHLQLELRRAMERLRSTSEVLDRNVMMVTTDANGRVKETSEAFRNRSGYGYSEITGQHREYLLHTESPVQSLGEFKHALSREWSWRGELRMVTKSADEYWVDCVISPKYGEDGRLNGYAHIMQDVSDRKAIEKLSITDQLTQIYNRRKLDELVAAEMQRFNRDRLSFSVILLDIDHFKKINDTLGHQAGDMVLKRVAACLTKGVREVDRVGRWGGEEFLIICPATDAKGASVLAEKLKQSLSAMPLNYPLRVTASFGVAQCCHGEAQERLITRVDEALYAAKSRGRNRVVRCSRAISAPGPKLTIV